MIRVGGSKLGTEPKFTYSNYMKPERYRSESADSVQLRRFFLLTTADEIAVGVYHCSPARPTGHEPKLRSPPRV